VGECFKERFSMGSYFCCLYVVEAVTSITARLRLKMKTKTKKAKTAPSVIQKNMSFTLLRVIVLSPMRMIQRGDLSKKIEIAMQ
jgi:hypothetical protein